MKSDPSSIPPADQQKIRERLRAALREQETIDYPFNDPEKRAMLKDELGRYAMKPKTTTKPATAAIAEVDRLRADLAKAQGLIDFLNQPLPVNSRTALIERCYQVQLICETIPAHENQTKTALALSDLVDAIRKSGGRGETLADLQRARADAERAKADNEQLRQHQQNDEHNVK